MTILEIDCYARTAVERRAAELAKRLCLLHARDNNQTLPAVIKPEQIEGWQREHDALELWLNRCA